MPWPAPGTIRLKLDPVLDAVASALLEDRSLNVAPGEIDPERNADAREALARGWLTKDVGADGRNDHCEYHGVSREGARAVAAAILVAVGE